VNFTREPIIETIITPKDGYKLVVRNSKGGGQQEEHFVDALEVVSFGHSFFFRSLERPKSFLVPVSDYEVAEVKETRVVLKNASVERSIKIGGGREGSMKREQPEKVAEAPAESDDMEAGEEAPVRSGESMSEQRNDNKKRDRRRHRRRRGERGEDRQEPRDWNEKPKQSEEEFKSTEPHAATSAAEQGGGANDETQVSSSMFSSLFPPPPTLISETIGRYKDFAVSEGSVLAKPVTETTEHSEQDNDTESSDTKDDF
jgi:hypothetical protein